LYFLLSSYCKLVETSRKTYLAFISVNFFEPCFSSMINGDINTIHRIFNAKTFYYFLIWIPVPTTAMYKNTLIIFVEAMMSITQNTGYQNWVHCYFEIKGEQIYKKKIPNWLRMLRYQDWVVSLSPSFKIYYLCKLGQSYQVFLSKKLVY
jgi:hypothetical protein